jgi:hypothetical protein
VKPFANQFTHGIVARLLARKPSSRMLAKTEGMLRFYLQGRLPLGEQPWPECLLEQKDSLMTALSPQNDKIAAPAGMPLPE